MQHLKRFTQCGSLTMIFTIFIILFGVSSTALTTFGKTNPISQPTQGPTVKGRDCISHLDCVTLQSTSCVKDPNDLKYRCLCGDNSTPLNGQCSQITAKGLHHICEKTIDCDDYLVCSSGEKPKNKTQKTSPASPNPNNIPECVCDEGNGYKENINTNACSGVDRHIVNNNIISILFLIAASLIFMTSYNSNFAIY